MNGEGVGVNGKVNFRTLHTAASGEEFLSSGGPKMGGSRFLSPSQENQKPNGGYLLGFGMAYFLF